MADEDNGSDGEGPKVEAEDGKVYEFGKRQKVKKESYVAENGDAVIKFVFRNGAVKTHRQPAGSPIYARLAVHGGDQKFGDEFAGAGDDVDDLVVSFEEMSKRLLEGKWSEGRTSDGLAGTSLLARALVKLSGKSIEEVKAQLSAVDGKVKSAMQKAPAVAAIIAELKAERDAKKPAKEQVDPTKALADFGITV